MRVSVVSAATVFLLLGLPSSAQAQPGSGTRYVVVADPSVLVGHYRLEEGEFAIDVRLNADRTAVYTVKEGEGGGGIRAEGRWTVEGDRIHIRNTPGPVSLEVSGPPSVDMTAALSIVATLPDGTPAEGLAVTWPAAGALFYMSDGVHRVAAADGPVTGEVSIVRESDSRPLATFRMSPGAPNSYRFTYRPSDPEPVHIQAAALDARAEMIEVEAGSAAAPLRRVRD